MPSADDIRTALCEHLRGTAGSGPAWIAHEVAVGCGLGLRRPLEARWYTTRGLRYYVGSDAYRTEPASARADVALVLPDALELYEIKGPGDSLSRLRTQVRAYDDTGSSNTLVVDAAHLNHAFDAVPTSWGILVAHGSPPVLEPLRAAQSNPARSVRGLTYPLYRRELLPLAQLYGTRLGSHAEFVDAFARGCASELELHERWFRRSLMRRPWAHRKHPAVAIGDAAGWYDRRLDDLLDAARRRYGGAQLALGLAADGDRCVPEQRRNEVAG